MVASILKIGISRNPICDNLVGFPKSGHIYIYVPQCGSISKAFTFSVIIISSVVQFCGLVA